jgi:hypothetical protein
MRDGYARVAEVPVIGFADLVCPIDLNIQTVRTPYLQLPVYHQLGRELLRWHDLAGSQKEAQAQAQAQSPKPQASGSFGFCLLTFAF